MASKFGLAGGIPERRVRPIWDAVDTRQFKNALKLSVALLAKYPNSPYALALKALILERMGKNEEALSVCLNAKEILCYNDPNTVVDDLTLSTLQIVFQRLDRLDMATSCYEHACAKYSDKDLMMGLFNCYVREYSFVKQQQIAIKMYKIWNEERFLLWAVCSIQLQVCCGNGEEKLLHLAEGLLKKHVASHDLQDTEALSIYISLLEKQCKFAEALEFLSGKLGSLMMIEVDRLCLQGRLLARAGDFTGAADVFQKVLELCPDDWECFLQYLGCLLEDETVLNKHMDPTRPTKPVVCKDLYITEELFDSRMSNAVDFIEKLVEENSNPIRGPYLALLEIERRKILFGKGDADKVAADLMLYFIRFGHLACFTSDIEQFLQVLDNNKKSEFLKKLVKEYEASVSDPTKALGCSISVFKIQNLLGDLFTLPVEDLVNLAVEMTEMFCKNLPLSKELDLQETMYGEELLSMACNLLVQVFWRTRDLGYLLESIMILEFGLAVRRYVWQYKISLVHLYSYWGSLPLAYERYKNLDVKNILLETVSHHILPQMLASPFWSDLKDLLVEYLKFMDDHLRESADLTFLAYRHKSYSKVIEFVQFKEGLQRSIQYLVAKVESAILQLKQNSNNAEEDERILENLSNGTHFVELSSEIRGKSLTFNEDLTLRPWWTPTYDRNYLLGPFEGVSFFPSKDKDNYIKQSQDNVLRTVEKRSLLPRMIYLSMRSTSASIKENIGANGSVVDPKLSSELKILLERHAKILDLSFHDAVELVLRISIGERSIEAPCSDIIDWMNFAVFLNAWNLYSHEITGSSTWKLVSSLLMKFVVDKIKCAGPLISSPGSDLPFLVQLVSEPLAWHALIIQSCIRSLSPSGKKKKKGGSVEQPPHSPLSRELRESIQSLCDSLELITKWLEEQLSISNDEKLETVFSSVERHDTSKGPGKVFKALQSSISLLKSDEVGNRIFEAVHSWNAPDVARKIIAGQDSLLSEFLPICKSKIKLLQSLRHQL